MRKSLAITPLLLILSVAFIASASGRVNTARDAVMFDETVLHGDRSAADGLALELRIHSDYRLFWDTSYIFSAEPELYTDFSFIQSQKRQTVERPYSGVIINFSAGFSVSSSGVLDLNSDDILDMSAVFKDVASRAKPGEEHTETVRLSDYYEFYPLTSHIDLPVYWFFENMDEIFKIPVADDCKLEIRISKNRSGEVQGYGMSVQEGYPNLWSKSVQTDDGCYFVLNSRHSDGTVYDTAHISLGYGIYYIPYYKADGRDYITANSTQMVYELTPGIEIVEFVASEDRSRLLLITCENEKCVLSVIDTATMTLIQRLEVFGYSDDTYVWVYPYNDFWVLMSGNLQKLAVVSLQSSGEYRLDFVTEFTDVPNANNAFFGSPVMAYDGERLAVAGFGDGTFGRLDTPNFYVSIYDKSGLAYSGSYRSSLSAGWDVDYSYICRSIDYEPLSVRWIS